MPNDFTVLSHRPLTARVAGVQIVLPYRPAAVWADGVSHIGSLIAELADPQVRDILADLAMDYPQAVEDLKTESFRLLQETTGRKWWEAARLIATSMSPQVLGRLVLAGVDPWNRTVGEWVSATYALCIKGADEKSRVRFEFSLARPPSGFEDEWDDGGDDPASTMAAVNAMLGGSKG